MFCVGAGMLAVIYKKRSKMAKKDTLLEEAAMSAAGLQQTHIIGIFVLTLIVIILFGLMGFKTITWTFLDVGPMSDVKGESRKSN